MSWNEINQKLQEIKTFQFKEDTIPDEGEDSKGRYYKRIEIGTGNDITNNTYGRLTAIFPVKDKNGKRKWLFKCDCGNTSLSVMGDVTFGKALSCGCVSKNGFINLKGQHLGRLTVLEYTGKDSKWRCQCECGNYTNAWAANLKNYKIISCGCAKISIGEKNILDILKENNVCFKREYRFDDCKNKKRLPFDFAIFNEEGTLTRLVEYDGQQHYKKNDYFGGEEGFKQTQLCDKIKNEYCLQNNIPLVRIPYTEKNITLDLILGDEYLI